MCSFFFCRVLDLDFIDQKYINKFDTFHSKAKRGRPPHATRALIKD